MRVVYGLRVKGITIDVRFQRCNLPSSSSWSSSSFGDVVGKVIVEEVAMGEIVVAV